MWPKLKVLRLTKQPLTAIASGINHHSPIVEGSEQVVSRVFQTQHSGALWVAEGQQTLGCRVHAAVNHYAGKTQKVERNGDALHYGAKETRQFTGGESPH